MQAHRCFCINYLRKRRAFVQNINTKIAIVSPNANDSNINNAVQHNLHLLCMKSKSTNKCFIKEVRLKVYDRLYIKI